MLFLNNSLHYLINIHTINQVSLKYPLHQEEHLDLPEHAPGPVHECDQQCYGNEQKQAGAELRPSPPPTHTQADRVRWSTTNFLNLLD